jgi:hypothetical protein
MSLGNRGDMDGLLIEDKTYRTSGNEAAEKGEIIKKNELRDAIAWGVGNIDRPSIRHIGAELFMAARCTAFRNEKQGTVRPECSDHPHECETCLRISIGFELKGVVGTLG